MKLSANKHIVILPKAGRTTHNIKKHNLNCPKCNQDFKTGDTIVTKHGKTPKYYHGKCALAIYIISEFDMRRFETSINK